MHFNVKFCLKFVIIHKTATYAKTAQSTELSQHVKQCVLATVWRDELLFWVPRFFLFLDSTPHFYVFNA